MIIFDSPVKLTDDKPESKQTWGGNERCRIRIIKNENTEGKLFERKYQIIATALGGRPILCAMSYIVPVIAGLFRMSIDDFIWFTQTHNKNGVYSKDALKGFMVLKPNQYMCSPEEINPGLFQWRQANMDELAKIKKYVSDIGKNSYAINDILKGRQMPSRYQ